MVYYSYMDPQVQLIKDRINIADVVGAYVTLRRAGRTFTAKCPFHNERTPSFHVSPERGTYMCFGCGEKGDIFSFVQKMDGIDFPSALRLMAEKAGVKLEQRSFKQVTPEEKEHDERLRDVCEAAVLFFESQLAKRDDVRKYLAGRGVHEDTVTAWRLGYAPATWDELSKHLRAVGFTIDDIVDAGFGIKSDKRPGEVFDRFRGRVIFPIFDVAGKPLAVSGRFFEDMPGEARKAPAEQRAEPAKYVNSPETMLFKKSRVLYGFDRARAAIRKLDCILLVEGQFDLVLAHQSGLPYAVALSGTALTPEHLSLLGRLSKRLVLALDADMAGIRAGLKSAHMAITAGFDVKVPTFPQGKDPADLARENPELLKAAVRTSQSAVEFFMDALKPSAKDEHAYAKLVEAQVVPLVAAVQSKIEQEQYIRLVATKLRVVDTAVRAEVAKRAAQRSAPEWEVPASPDLQQKSAESMLTPLQKKAGMLLFRFGRESSVGARLAELLGTERMAQLEQELAPLAEGLRFRFDSEVIEQPEERIAEDMLGEIGKVVAKERFKMKFL
jgi:DNA primase